MQNVAAVTRTHVHEDVAERGGYRKGLTDVHVHELLADHATHRSMLRHTPRAIAMRRVNSSADPSTVRTVPTRAAPIASVRGKRLRRASGIAAQPNPAATSTAAPRKASTARRRAAV